MAGLPTESLPAAQQDPMGILQGQHDKALQYNRSQYDTELNSLKQSHLTDQDFYKGLDDLNMRHQQIVNKQNYEADQKLQEVKRVQSLIDSQQIGSEAGQEAIWRLVLPSETERAMFQTAGRQGRQPLSISALSSEAMKDSIKKYAGAAPEKPGFEWGKPKKFKEGLVQQYLDWRMLQGYDDPTMTPMIKYQLDTQWDAHMRENRYSEWWSDKGKRKPIVEVKALRATGKIGKAYRDRVTQAGVANPLAASVKPTKRTVSPYSMETRRGVSLTKEPKRTEVPTGGMARPTTQAEYNSVPSGAQYIGSDGQVRTKR